MCPFEGRFPINVGITGYVATTGETLNIPDVLQDDRFDPSVDEDGTFCHHSILCMPIRNASTKIVGVCQLINKLSKIPFNKNDEHLFEAFAIFWGMGIQNTQMYEKAVKAIAKTKVTLEVLSYHATAPLEEAKQLSKCILPSTHVYRLQDLRFNDFSLDDEDMLKACLRMFVDLDLIKKFHIKYDKDELISVAVEMRLVITSKAKIIDLKRLIESSAVYKNDIEFVRSLVENALEKSKQEAEKNEHEAEIQLEKIKLS
ncbi:dual 3',5'-cyclic-AMP and -GMP phosphodiesterase 11 [Trichonephila clavipes]|nr:dual 3',5'-cyclic-AMP and -GMP phosphodiesterase 11 [Trichonephila clavipes]